ncbi:PepSY domain-containing protein [Flammeovirgaceae bacterium SG7u.111]|nr:PepSY domain-containing protein [Flammeovirgaceae bacterium SG7u.132]WPO38765.1 PepSY domain-containing protein [Flammeovirgaceae bacterium SG7u.111]
MRPNQPCAARRNSFEQFHFQKKINLSKSMNKKMRIYHRYLGFFLAGIMAVYALSGIVLIFRNTDFLKQENQYTKSIPADTKTEMLGRELGIKNLKVTKTEEGIMYFKGGEFNTQTGEATYTKKELPFVLDKMVHLHKANSDRPLFFLNIFFGLSLLFFVISSFWMFTPKSSVFKKGVYFTLAGLAFALIIIFV